MAVQGFAICWVRKGHGSSFTLGKEGFWTVGRTGLAGPEGMEGTPAQPDPQGGYFRGLCPHLSLGELTNSWLSYAVPQK